jgi:MFS family permease
MSLTRRYALDLPAHRRVFAAFFLYAFGFGGFFPRLAELQSGMGLSEGELGMGLIGTAIGSLVSLSLGGKVVAWAGARNILLTLPIIVTTIYALASLAVGQWSLFAVLVCAGLLIGIIEVVVNVEADRVEHLYGRRIMSRSHAFWSFGFFSAGLLGALAARLGISPQWQLAAMVPLAAMLVPLLLGRFDPAPPRPGSNESDTPHMARPTWHIMALVMLSLSALVLEGAGFDWSAIYMRDVFSGAPFMGGMAVAIGAFAQAVARYLADPFVERYSPLVVTRTLLYVLGAGTLAVTFAPHPAVALLGFALMGVGTSVVFPLAVSAAAQRTDRPAATNVAALAQFAFVAFLLAPPCLGWIAEHWNIRVSYGVCLPLVLVSLLASGALRPRPASSHAADAATEAAAATTRPTGRP